MLVDDVFDGSFFSACFCNPFAKPRPIPNDSTLATEAMEAVVAVVAVVDNPDTIFGVAAARRSARNAATVVYDLEAKNKLTMPVTWGVDMEVPEMVLVVPIAPIHRDVMDTPGAYMATQVP